MDVLNFYCKISFFLFIQLYMNYDLGFPKSSLWLLLVCTVLTLATVSELGGDASYNDIIRSMNKIIKLAFLRFRLFEMTECLCKIWVKYYYVNNSLVTTIPSEALTNCCIMTVIYKHLYLFNYFSEIPAFVSTNVRISKKILVK